MQLGQAKALGVFDDHQAGIRHIDTDLDHRGRHQQLQRALLEFSHDRGFFCGFHAPVDQPDANLAQSTGEFFVRGFSSLAGQFFGLFDQRADPIRLAPLGTGCADAFDDFQAAAVGNQHRIDRRSAGRQFVENRSVQVSVGAHRQRARDGCGGHDQLVRAHQAADALLAQRQTLLNTEPVLLVDDHQCQILELHLVLKQGVGTNHHGRARSDLLQ
ncbi:hypothetical protein ALP75_204885 [Pseudomonas syringae pv. actinidiae]|nr:hypothetical protein ALP75_204885 [Pseudomonas syringae pv. actinidiae]